MHPYGFFSKVPQIAIVRAYLCGKHPKDELTILTIKLIQPLPERFAQVGLILVFT